MFAACRRRSPNRADGAAEREAGLRGCPVGEDTSRLPDGRHRAHANRYERSVHGPGTVIVCEPQAALAQAYRIAADRSGAELLAASTVSIDHGLGSDEP